MCARDALEPMKIVTKAVAVSAVDVSAVPKVAQWKAGAFVAAERERENTLWKGTGGVKRGSTGSTVV